MNTVKVGVVQRTLAAGIEVELVVSIMAWFSISADIPLIFEEGTIAPSMQFGIWADFVRSSAACFSQLLTGKATELWVVVKVVEQLFEVGTILPATFPTAFQLVALELALLHAFAGTFSGMLKH